MDNSGNDNYFPGMYGLPSVLGTYLYGNPDALNLFNTMGIDEREDLISYSHEFQSKEELERYLYHLNDDEFK